MPAKGKIIVLRFSAMGDVAMVASVLKEFSLQNPDVELVMVSRQAFEPFFKDINNLIFHAIHPKTLHKGVKGLYSLYKELKKYQPITIADLHDNLRSRILSMFFRIAGVKVKRIDKGRAEKRALTRPKNKVLKQLTLTVERYAIVFRALNFNLKLSHKLQSVQKDIPQNARELFKDNEAITIGISPFAQHIYKVYPLEKMERVIDKLNDLGFQILIFGGGNDEKNNADNWASKFIHVKNVIGKFTLTEELNIISNLDLMLSMDSSGMHMASLMGIRVVSIWGPTHPYAGFLGYGQNYGDCLQIEHPSRPNSIYGNKPCICGVQSCIDGIDPGIIVQKIIEIVNGKRINHHQTRKI
ncbi:glycosyltransferase family 9 protein [Pedobacter polaris]|uniref:Glycosyltransferase family 9 protein n=1 Tax=Pedobacter polaris TaxID=2571273 RepID=A0A4U1CGU9_9SPHI|nr:glycosyltransferase family 9 protein [Pedobacter polaris]TKC06515.1 glycosyltransferase family 9 protein [Pedobacter polaris]